VRSWRDSPARAELLALYAAAEALLAGCECRCASATRPDDAQCCLFARTGREPYPTPIELCEVDHGLRARGVVHPPRRSKLPLLGDSGACPLLSQDGRCTIYASRPFGCRTFFCQGHEPPKKTRDAVQGIGRRVRDLAARMFPADALPRPFTRALSGPLPAPPLAAPDAKGG
jgi:Fe-S-cluster containining protein